MHSPAYHLVIETAKQNWSLMAINLVTNVLSALLEGSTLGIIYLAIAYLSESSKTETSTPANSAIMQVLTETVPLPPEQMFLVLIIGALLLQAFLSLSNYVNRVATAHISAKAQTYVTSKVFERIMTFSYGCVSRYKVGDLVLFSTDAALAVDRQIEEINSIVVSIFFSLMYLAVIVRLSPVLAAAAALLTLVVASVQYKLIPRLRHAAKRVTATKVESAKYMTESIQALRLLHTFGTQQSTINKANGILDKTRKNLQKRAFLYYFPEPILDILPMIALAILAASAVIFQEGQSTILPMLLTFLLALQRLSTRLKATAMTFTRFADNSARMLRLEVILDRRDKEFERSGSETFNGLERDIEFQSVSLTYGQDNTFALKNLTFQIPRNQVIALVGESGAGKSSIVDLLMGIYQPTNGEIVVNGRSLAAYNLKDWRQYIGVVSQDTFIFNDSILENLCYGLPKVSWDDVVDCTKAAQAHEFILALPDGYDTVVGERGYRLSGGQRQRLALARALIKQPEILILDEATSALDSESEKLIQQALEQLKEDRTIIVVAHRLSTVADADKILVLEKGQVIESGHHQILICQGGRYAKYWQLQS